MSPRLSANARCPVVYRDGPDGSKQLFNGLIETPPRVLIRTSPASGSPAAKQESGDGSAHQLHTLDLGSIDLVQPVGRKSPVHDNRGFPSGPGSSSHLVWSLISMTPA